MSIVDRLINKTKSYWGVYFLYYKNAPTIDSFDFHNFRNQLLTYTKSLRVGDFSYKFSYSTESPSLYSSCYACMLRGLLNDIDESEKKGWLDYFDSFQNENGLFYDPLISKTKEFETGDGWGARHLLPHLLIAYTRLGGVPQKEFHFLKPFEDREYMIRWLNSLDLYSIYSTSNQIMNILCALQYCRDKMNGKFKESISVAEKWLLERFNPDTGLWFPFRNQTKDNLNNAIRGSYHIFPIFVYDGISMSVEQTASSIRGTQNFLGGFDTNLCSSACYDIDGIEPFIRFSNSDCEETEKVLTKAFKWIMSNQNSDGGFVFQRYAHFSYGGDPLMESEINESNMFATWFRSLSIFYILEKLGLKSVDFIKVPGYEMPIG